MRVMILMNDSQNSISPNHLIPRQLMAMTNYPKPVRPTPLTLLE